MEDGRLFGKEKIDNKNAFDICGQNKKLIVMYQTYIKEYNLNINEKGNYINEVGKLDIDKKIYKKGKLKKIFLLNKQFEEEEDNNQNEKIVCIFKDFFYVYEHQ